MDEVSEICRGPGLHQLKARLEQYPGTPVLKDFPDNLRSRSQWYKRLDRRVQPRERPKAIVAWEHDDYSWEMSQEFPSGEEQWRRAKTRVVTPVNLFSIDQTVPVTKQPRTRAFEKLWEIFCEPSHPDFKIPYLPVGPRTSQGKITEDDFLRHIRGARDIAVRMGRYTRFIGLDHDLHQGDRSVFERQLRILLDELWGRSTWHLQVKDKEAKGVHLFCVFDELRKTEEVVAELRDRLRHLDERFPELSTEAPRHKMKSFSSMEIKPTQQVGLRLPLASGRVMLLDRPLGQVTYRGKQEPDVVAYCEWLEKASAGEATNMTKEEVFQFVAERLVSSTTHNRTHTSIIVPPGEYHPDRNPPKPVVKDFKGMKNSTWNRLVRAWGGHMESDSLNHWIRQLSLYAPFKFATPLEAAEAIEQFIDELPDHSFSDRLLAGDRTKVSAVIERSVGQAFEGWKGQRDPKKSAEKLRAVWSRWAATGRDPFDKDTWATVPKITSYRDVKLAPDFEWTPDEYRHLDQLAKLLNADLESTSRAVKDFARLVLTHAEVPRTWIAALLCDHGIPAKSKKLDKPKVFIDYLLEMSWVYVQVQHFTRRCRRFGLAKLRSKFPAPGIKDSCGSPRQGNEATPSATTSRSFVAAPICPARTHQSPPNQFVLFAGRLIPPRIDFQFVFIRGGHNILSG